MTDRRLQLLLLLLICFITFVVNNGVIEANIMEARNLTTAREILQKNNWLEPTMNGELRLEKPPLPTWISALTLFIFGEENLSLLRLPSALAALLMVFFLFKLTTTLTEDRLLPILAAGTAATSFYIFFMARDISWDIFCHSFMIGAIWLIHKALKSKGRGWRELVGAGILMGLSFMSKGPVSFYSLLLPYFIARSFSYGWKGVSDKKMALIAMIFITIVISLWWPLFIWFSHPEFSAQIAHRELSAWFIRNTRSLYHYWSFPVQSGVWSIFATIALFFPYSRPRINKFGNYIFLSLWVVSAVVLLSLFPEKKERYLLPVLLPIALLTAYYFRYLIESFNESSSTKADVVILRFNAILMAFICFFLPVVLIFLPSGKGRPGSGLLILIFILFWGLATFIIGSFRKKNPLWLWMGMVGMVLSVCVLLIPSALKLAMTNTNYHSYKELRHRDDLNGIPFFFDGDVHGKFIEVIWGCGHAVKEWNPVTQQHIPVTPPLLILSNRHPSDLLPAEILKNYRIEVIGHFDTNMRKFAGENILSNYATVIRQKPN